MKDCCSNKGHDGPDLVVIGAGSAGFSAAITAVGGGKRVALVGHGTIGGTCVNVGCVPSKAMIRAAEAVHAARAAGRFPGLTPCAPQVDWPALARGTAELVAEMRAKKYENLLPEYEGLDYIEDGPAHVEATEAGFAVVTETRRIEAPRVIVATGSHPRMPQIEGIDTTPVLDSTGLLTLGEAPGSLIVMGGGYIGVELAQMAHRLGAEVTLVTRSRLLPGAEPEVARALTRALTAEGLRVETGLDYVRVAPGFEGVALTIARDGAETTLTARHLVATTGRAPNADGLGLEALGVARDDAGAIVVGEDMQTSHPGLYAAGDVTDRDHFVYMAAFGARIAAENAVLGGNRRYDNSAMPWVVFSDPQVAGVGLTEAQARAAGRKVKTSVLGLDNVPRALAARDTRGLIKLVAEEGSDRLLGGQIVAPEGADSIQTLAMALKAGLTARELGETIFPYLTTVEGLKLAAQTFDMDVEKLSCCAG